MLSRFKMAPRLALGFSALMALAALIGAFAMSCLADVNGNTRDIATNWLVSTRALGQYRDAVGLVRRVEVITALMSGAAHEEEQDKAIEQGKRDARDAWKLYVPTITDGPERQLAERIVEAQDAYYVQQGKVKQMGSQPELRDQALAAYLGESRAAYQKLATAIHDDIAYQTRGGNAAYASAQASYTKARYEILGLLATAMVVGAFLAWKITVSITKPLMIAVDAAERVAKGNLHEMRVVAGRDETGQLLRSLADMRRSLVDVVGQVRTSADSIATGSSQIASGSIDLSQRTEEQASNLQQTAASMEELTATVRQNADSATAAMSMAAETAVAVTGVRETAQAVARSMLKIEESSRKVSDIIGVIDGIAFQTNILALNAAVEAARAGEHGRGFAVVASEVRALAQRSAGAAKEIKGLIALSSGAVEAGSEQVNRAGVAIGNIAGRVAQVDELVAQIAIASREQSTGIGQVGDAVGQLDQVTQQNAALVEESAAAAESLRVQAARLAETVSFFQIESADLTHAG